MKLLLLGMYSCVAISQEVGVRIPQFCRTNAGDDCIFPFVFNGQTFTKCTYAKSPTPWCATKVDQNGVVVTNKWGDCDFSDRLSSCETDSTSACVTTGGPVPNAACIFPFKHNGQTYSTCTEVTIGRSWCSTSTKSDGTHIIGQYGLCPSSCPVSSSNKFSSPSCKPGSTWKKDCNTCTCSSSSAPICTERVCSNNCRTNSGPARGRKCVFPFSFGGRTYNECAMWTYGGINKGKFWCSTSTDVEGKHINGQGNYGICGPECPSENDDDLVKIKNRLNDGAIVFDGNRSDQPS